MFFVAMPYALVILFSLDMSNGAMEKKRCKKVFFYGFFSGFGSRNTGFLKIPHANYYCRSGSGVRILIKEDKYDPHSLLFVTCLVIWSLVIK